MSQKVFIVFGNHGAVTHTQDGMELIRKALLRIGVDALYTAEPEPNSINIFAENFTNVQLKRYFDCKKRYPTTKYIVIASELVTGNTFNDVGLPEDGSSFFCDREFWKTRFDNFMKFTTCCTDVWTLIPPPHDMYRELFKNTNIKVSYFPHCSIGYQDCSARDWKEKDIDVFFSGTMTSYRQEIIKMLETEGLKVICRLPERTPNFVRKSFIRRAKVCLGLKLGEHSQFGSAGRIHYYLTQKVRHISEKTPLTVEIDRYITHFQKSDILDVVRTCIEEPDSFMPDFELFHAEMAADKVMHEIADSIAFRDLKL